MLELRKEMEEMRKLNVQLLSTLNNFLATQEPAASSAAENPPSRSITTAEPAPDSASLNKSRSSINQAQKGLPISWPGSLPTPSSPKFDPDLDQAIVAVA